MFSNTYKKLKKMKILIPSVVACAFMLLGISCSKTKDVTVDPPPPSPTDSTIAPNNFTFATSKTVNIDVRLLTNDDKPIPGVLVNVYGTDTASKDGPVFTAVSDINGYIRGSVDLPAYMDTFYVDPSYIGLISYAKAYVTGQNLTCTIGGTSGFSGNILKANKADESDYHHSNTFFPVFTGPNFTQSISYSYLGGYDNSGRPNNLVTPSDVVSAQLLSFLNASLPEQRPVPTYHPDYLTGSAETNLNITALSDVWITFVSEGAGYQNSLGFYTYPTNTPPASVNDIGEVKIAIPNASLSGSGGNMRSGDKILLGRIPAGTSIGFVIFQNAWNGGTRLVNTSATKFFADDNLNANEDANHKRHTVLLYDDINELFVVGFEDLTRSTGGSDDDFNDLLFYATSNPVEAISRENVNPVDQPVDTDDDGVNDTYDKFPTDPERAYIQYYPSESNWGTLNFEDLWPSVGDYDLNDLVLGYRYKYINNGLNKTVEMYGEYAVRAVGASFQNGFGVQLPILPSKISSITGQKTNGNMITKSPNGTEAGQTYAVFIPFDNTKAIFPDAGIINTYAGAAKRYGDTTRVFIRFTTPLTAAELGSAPYNPFLIADQKRGYEVHLPGQKPTSLANTQLFKTGQDKTNPNANVYYLSTKNWPYAMSYAETFNYPIESKGIDKAYSKFLDWARSGGVSFPDWYTDKSGYRESAFIYH